MKSIKKEISMQQEQKAYIEVIDNTPVQIENYILDNIQNDDIQLILSIKSETKRTFHRKKWMSNSPYCK